MLDNVDKAPASLGGWSLVGRSWQRAKVACDHLRRIYDNRLEARSFKDGTKPSVDSPDRIGDLVTSIRKARDLERDFPNPTPGGRTNL